MRTEYPTPKEHTKRKERNSIFIPKSNAKKSNRKNKKKKKRARQPVHRIPRFLYSTAPLFFKSQSNPNTHKKKRKKKNFAFFFSGGEKSSTMHTTPKTKRQKYIVSLIPNERKRKSPRNQNMGERKSEIHDYQQKRKKKFFFDKPTNAPPTPCLTQLDGRMESRIRK